MEFKEGDIIERTPMLIVGAPRETDISQVNDIPVGTYRIKWHQDNFIRSYQLHSLIGDIRKPTGDESYMGTDKGKEYAILSDMVDEPFFRPAAR